MTRPRPTHTHTVVELPISAGAHAEISGLLREALYDHVFMPDGMIDMTGIGLTVAPSSAPGREPVAWLVETAQGVQRFLYNVELDAETCARRAAAEMDRLFPDLAPCRVVPLFAARSLPDTGAAPPSHTDLMISPEAIAAMDFPDTSASSVPAHAGPSDEITRRIDEFVARFRAASKETQSQLAVGNIGWFIHQLRALAAQLSGDSDETARSDTARLDWLEGTIDDATTAEFDTTLWRDWDRGLDVRPLFAVSSSFAGEGRGESLREAIDAARSSTPSPGSDQ
jgi:hypothetical protein